MAAADRLRLREIAALTRMRTVLFVREPEAVFWVFGFPLLLALVLGLAFRDRGAEPVRVALVLAEGAAEPPGLDAGGPGERREGGGLDLRRAADVREGGRMLLTGEAAALLLVDRGGGVVLRYDPGRPESDVARLEVLDRVQRGAGRVDPVPVALEEVRETGARYIDWLIPGLIGMNLMSTGIWGVGFGLVEARQQKVLKRFLVTPMRRSSLLLASVLSRLGFLVAEVAVVAGFAWGVLDVPMRGSLVVFAAVCLVGSTGFAGLGLLVAARVETIEGASGLMNLVMMPMWLCSGIFFSYHRFPEVVLPVIRALPLTALNDALRAVMLEGAGLIAVLPELGVQVAWGVLTFALALRLFRWQ